LTYDDLRYYYSFIDDEVVKAGSQKLLEAMKHDRVASSMLIDEH